MDKKTLNKKFFINKVELKGQVCTNVLYFPNKRGMAFYQFCIVVPRHYNYDLNDIFMVRASANQEDFIEDKIKPLRCGDLVSIKGQLRTQDRLDENGNPKIEYYIDLQTISVCKMNRKQTSLGELMADDFNQFAEY